MPKGIRRCVSITMLAVAGLFFTGCASTGRESVGGDKEGENYGKALLYVDRNLCGAGVKKVYAYPDRIVITNYEITPEQKITWSYIHTSTKITFPEPKIADKVKCEKGTCTLTLPKGLFDGINPDQRKIFLKYKITGSDKEGPLHDNDPDLEVDR